jgi:hypothetical protein
MPHAIHAIVAVVSLTVFVVLAAAFTAGEMELDFRTKNQLAMMHTGCVIRGSALGLAGMHPCDGPACRVEFQTFVIRVLMTFTSVFVNSQKWMSVAELGLSACLVYLVWFWQPQLYGWVNHVRVGAYTSVCWCSIIFLVLAFGLGECVHASSRASWQQPIHLLSTLPQAWT